MPYNRAIYHYGRKPSAGLQPNWNNPFAKGLEFFIPFTEGAGVPSAYHYGARKYPDTVTVETIEWSPRRAGRSHSESHRQATSSGTDVQYKWDDLAARGTSDWYFFCVLNMRTTGGGFRYAASQGNYDPGYVAFNNAQAYQYVGSAMYSGSTHVAGDTYAIASYRRGGTKYIKVLKNSATLYTNSAATSDNETSTGISIGARGTGGLSVQDMAAYNWLALWNKTPAESEILRMLYNPDSMWNIYSRPLPIWISSGAAPPAWNNSMNKISAPGSVNKITNANIQSINEI